MGKHFEESCRRILNTQNRTNRSIYRLNEAVKTQANPFIEINVDLAQPSVAMDQVLAMQCRTTRRPRMKP
jgi:hypothetical protein